MIKWIIKIHLGKPYLNEKDIIEVQLFDGTLESVNTVINYINIGMRYFVKDNKYPFAQVEVVDNKYIRTKADGINQNNLFYLPRY